MTGKKRSCTCNAGEGQKQKSKKQKTVPATASASVIDEALKVDSQQNVLLMEFVRRFVREAVEQVEKKFKQEVKRQVEKKVKQEVKRVKQDVKRALANFGIVIYGERSPPKQIEGPDGRNLQLCFRSRLSLPLFTEVKVEGEQDAAIYVVLIDKNTGNPVTSGPESSAKLEVVVLEGDFNNEDDDDWTREDFESQVVKVREGKRPILIGDLKVSLKEGVGSLGEFTFTDNSSWTRSKKFRLGAKVASDFCEGIRIREAKTDAFKVKDHRGKSYKKHHPPELGDEVWRLEKIHKNGTFHKRLNKAKVHNVQDFLRLLVTDSGRLREILQKSMSDMKWNILEKHARTCVLSKTQYVYYADDTKTTGVIFNIIYELTGLIADGKYYSAETLSYSQKVFVDTLVKKAYDNWMHVIEYDGRMLLNMKQSKIASSSQTKVTIEAPEDYPISFDQQVSLPCLPSSVPSEQAFMNPGLAVGGGMWYDDNFGNRYPAHSQHSNAQMQLKRSSFERQIQHINSSDQSQIKAVVGWLKLKAALRWGIFIRKKAAEKRELFQLEVFLGLMCEP